jgi:hypothetical protein
MQRPTRGGKGRHAAAKEDALRQRLMRTGKGRRAAAKANTRLSKAGQAAVGGRVRARRGLRDSCIIYQRNRCIYGHALGQ